jgi:AAA domain-containing protein/uncharacterized protein DUF3854
MTLTAAHLQMLTVDSAISPEVVQARGYRSLSLTEAAKLLPGLGFSVKVSKLGAGLLFPLTLPDDPAPLYQFRPDHPRRDDDGKAQKYEIPHGRKQRLIVHPHARAALQDGVTPLYITEGAKKVDSLVSHGAAALGGIGVWSFTVPRTAAEKKHGAPKVLLPEWHPIPLQGRQVLLVFDSDAALNGDVEQAEQELAGLLRATGAQVSRVRLPAKPDGTKQGVDDYLAQTHSLAEVHRLAEPMPRPRFDTISAPDLYKKTLAPMRWAIPGKLPVGATLFVGRGKDGKSLMVWNIALATVTGGKALGAWEVEQGDVLYLALEDGERRGQDRLNRQMAACGMDAPPPGLDLVFWTAPRIDNGFLERLETWVDEHPNGRLVIVDILEKIRPARTSAGVYADDYHALEALQQFGQQRNLAILVVHHSNKSKPADFRDSVNGSMGLVGACDTFWSLSRLPDAPEATLKMTGREIEPQDLALEFKDGFWTALGDSAMVRMSEERQEIVDVLGDSPKPLRPIQVAALLEKNVVTTKRLLGKMLAVGVLMQPTDGHYAVSPSYLSQSVNPVNPVNPVNCVNPVNPTEKGEEKQAVPTQRPVHVPEVGIMPVHDGFTAVHGGFTPEENTQPIEKPTLNGGTVHGFTGFTPTYPQSSIVLAADCYPPPAACCPGWVCAFSRSHRDHWHNASDQPICSLCHPRPHERRN